MPEERTYYKYFAIWTWYLYSHRLSTVLRPHHRSFFVQWIVFNTETHNWLKVKRTNAWEVLSRKLNMFPKGSRNIMDKGGRKTVIARDQEGLRQVIVLYLIRSLLLWIHSCYGCLHKTCTWSSQSSMSEKWANKSLYISEDLLTVNGC